MESVILLAGLFFIGGPILLFFLVIGARSRVRVLEEQVQELQWKVRHLSAQPADSLGTEQKPVAQDADEGLRGQADWQQPADIEPRAIPLKDLPRGVTLTVSRDPAPETVTSTAAAHQEIAQTLEKTADAEEDRLPDAYRPEETTDPASSEDARQFEMPEPPAWLSKAKDWLLGGNLVAKAGLLILFFGVSFLIKYAAARVTLPIEFRLSGIVLADLILLVWGWRIRESRPAISLPVQGAALGILMLVTFGAYRMYDLIPGSIAFGLLFALTAFTCLLAVLQDAIWLAIFGIVGGFAAPILTSTGKGSHIGLFSYYALLNAGVLAIALKRSWRLLNLLGFAFTFVIATVWGVLRYEAQDYASVQGFLILFLLFYVAISVFYALRQAPRLTHYVDGTLVFGTPLVAFGLQYGIVRDKPFGLAFSALAMGLFYITLTLGLWKRRGDSLKLLVESFLALGIVFGTLAIPLALDGRWTSAAWALEGAGIVWVGLRQRQTLAWIFGVLVQVGAWISFMLSMFNLDRSTAMESNLWLGFLLLAVTGLAMAMNFRREVERRGEEDDEQADTASRILTWLATGFLGFAALWLLAGAWTEIFLRGGVHTHTLLVISAMGVAGILGLIAARLDWHASRYFALAPQIAAGGVFLWTAYNTFDWFPVAYTDSLFDSGFLGGLLIALGAGVSSLAFRRQEETRALAISRMLLGWCGFWWFVYVLGNLDAWGGRLLASYNLYAEAIQPAIHPLYGLVVALTTPIIARLALRLQWGDLRWLSGAVWLNLLFVIARMFERLDGVWSDRPQLLAWIALLVLWLAGESLMRDGERERWLPADRQPVLVRALHLLRTVGPWLLLWPLCIRVFPRVLGADPEQAPLLSEAAYLVVLDWGRYLTAWTAFAVVAVLLRCVRRQSWPTTPIADWYRQVVMPIWVICCTALVILWNFTMDGSMQPLPYLPIVNPLDLTTGFIALLAFGTYRLYSPASDRAHALHRHVPIVAALAGYVWFNLMLLRSAAHYLDIPYKLEPLFHSQFVQAMLSLVWSMTALLLMRFAAGRKLRLPWMAGAGLLVLVVAKLFFIDLTNVGGVERIISFLGVGVLMLAIGYLAPFPTEPKTDEK